MTPLKYFLVGLHVVDCFVLLLLQMNFVLILHCAVSSTAIIRLILKQAPHFIFPERPFLIAKFQPCTASRLREETTSLLQDNCTGAHAELHPF